MKNSNFDNDNPHGAKMQAAINLTALSGLSHNSAGAANEMMDASARGTSKRNLQEDKKKTSIHPKDKRQRSKDDRRIDHEQVEQHKPLPQDDWLTQQDVLALTQGDPETQLAYRNKLVEGIFQKHRTYDAPARPVVTSRHDFPTDEIRNILFEGDVDKRRMKPEVTNLLEGLDLPFIQFSSNDPSGRTDCRMQLIIKHPNPFGGQSNAKQDHPACQVEKALRTNGILNDNESFDEIHLLAGGDDFQDRHFDGALYDRAVDEEHRKNGGQQFAIYDAIPLKMAHLSYATNACKLVRALQTEYAPTSLIADLGPTKTVYLIVDGTNDRASIVCDQVYIGGLGDQWAGPYKIDVEQTVKLRKQDANTDQEEYRRMVVQIPTCVQFTADYEHAGAVNYHSSKSKGLLKELRRILLQPIDQSKFRGQIGNFLNLDQLCRVHIQTVHRDHNDICFHPDAVGFNYY